jgi:hypothetical protein
MALTGWLSSEGFTILEPVNAGLRVSGTIATAEKAFGIAIVKSPGGYYYANQTEPEIPARFADVVGLIIGLDNFWATALFLGTPPARPRAHLVTRSSSTQSQHCQRDSVTALRAEYRILESRND